MKNLQYQTGRGFAPRRAGGQIGKTDASAVLRRIAVLFPNDAADASFRTSSRQCRHGSRGTVSGDAPDAGGRFTRLLGTGRHPAALVLVVICALIAAGFTGCGGKKRRAHRVGHPGSGSGKGSCTKHGCS